MRKVFITIAMIAILSTLTSCITMNPGMLKLLANHHASKGNTEVADYYYLQAYKMEEDMLLLRTR
ncbi:MAG: hypothetical protein ACI4NM_04220 [Bullifex sp.]